MKKLASVAMLLLAVNFLAVVGGVGYLKYTGKIDRGKVMAIKEIIFPSTQPTNPDPSTTQPVAEGPKEPILKLEELLAQQSGRPATEQVDFIQHTFDAQMAQLDRRQRELADLQRQVELAKEQIARDRGTLDTQRKELETTKNESVKLETDKGFQDSLMLYKSMAGKQVKTIFMSLDDKVVSQYLQAMEPRTAARIVKEFKSPEETQFIQKALERIRKAQEAPPPAQQPPQASTKE